MATSSPRTDAQLARVGRIRDAVRSSATYHDALAKLAQLGETWDGARKVLDRVGVRIRDDLSAALAPPYEPGPHSRPPVEVVDDLAAEAQCLGMYDEPPPTLPSGEIPVYVDLGGPADNEEPTAAPGVGWTVEEPVERILFVPDTHAPFHDAIAWGVMMAAARRFRPTRIVILGDFLDFMQVSSHDTSPERRTSIDHDLQIANGLLDQLDALGATHRHYIEGNHEFRLTRYLWSKAPALLASVKLPELLRLAERGWSWTPYREHLRIHDLWVTHETGHAGAWAHQRSAADFMGSVVIGHTHRIGQVAFGNALGERFTATMCGWLGAADGADYMHASKKARDWSHGFGLGVVVGGRVVVQPVAIVDRAAVVDGAVVRMAG
jgi:hypothetical protein